MKKTLLQTKSTGRLSTRILAFELSVEFDDDYHTLLETSHNTFFTRPCSATAML